MEDKIPEKTDILRQVPKEIAKAKTNWERQTVIFPNFILITSGSLPEFV